MPRHGRISVRRRIGPGRYQTSSYEPWEYQRLLAAEAEAARRAAMTPEERRAEDERETAAARRRGWATLAVVSVALIGFLLWVGRAGSSKPAIAPASFVASDPAAAPKERRPRDCRTLLLGSPTPDDIAKYDRCERTRSH